MIKRRLLQAVTDHRVMIRVVQDFVVAMGHLKQVLNGTQAYARRQRTMACICTSTRTCIILDHQWT